MRYKVKLSYPAVVRIGKREYSLFPGKEVELPENEERTKNLLALGYIEPVEEKKKGGKRK